MTPLRSVVGLVVAIVAGIIGDLLVDRSIVDRPLFSSASILAPTGRRIAFVTGSMLLAVLAMIRFADAPSSEMLAYVVLFVVLLTLSWIDAREYRLPDMIVLPSIAIGALVVVIVSVVDDTPIRIRYALIGAAVAFAVLLVAHLVSPRGMGFGDVKFAALLGLAVGWQASGSGEAFVLVLWLLLIGFAVGTIAGVVLLLARRRNQPFPFGPFLAIGAVITVLMSRSLVG